MENLCPLRDKPCEKICEWRSGSGCAISKIAKKLSQIESNLVTISLK